MLRNSKDRYGLVSKAFHWLIAIGITGLIWLGWWMVGLSYYDAWYNRGLELHRALGMLVLALAALFLVWKLITPSPPLQCELKPWEKAGTWVAHTLLLLSMFAIPISGYMISTSAGKGFTFFNVFTVPAMTQISQPARDLAIELHYYLAYGLIAIIVAHVGAALKHQFIDRHGTLRRML